MARQAAAGSPHLSVIVLVYDEVDSIEPLHRELMGVLDGLSSPFEVLYIDDGSSDGSAERLGQLASHESRVRVVSFSAISARLPRSRRESTTAVATCWCSWTATSRTTRMTSRRSSRRST